MELRVNEAAIIEISATLRTGAANPTAGNINVAIRFFKVGHANHLKYWDGDSWETGPVYVTSAQIDFHAHEVSLAATALVAGMERGIITVRAASTLDIGGEARFKVVPVAWLTDAVYVSATHGDTIANGADGSRGNPVSTIADMDTLAAANGVRRAIFLDNASYQLVQTYADWVFEGEHRALIDMNGQTLSDTVCRELTLTGTGNPNAIDCSLYNAVFEGIVCYRTIILGTCTLGSGSSPTYLIDCSISGATVTLKDQVFAVRLGGTGTFVGLTTGTVNLIQLEGVFTLDNTNTGGTINISGIFDLTDNSNGTTVNLTDGALSLTGINNGGPGLYQVVIHVQDGVAAPISEVKVHVFDSTNASPRWFGETDTSGNATFNLGAGTFSVRLAKGTTGFTVPESIVVTQDETFTLVGTPFVAPTAVDPGDCAVYGTIWDSENKEWAGVQIDVYATTPQFVGDITMGKRLGTTHTDAAGKFTIDLGKGVRVRFVVEDAGIDFTKTVPDAANVDIKDWT